MCIFLVTASRAKRAFWPMAKIDKTKTRSTTRARESGGSTANTYIINGINMDRIMRRLCMNRVSDLVTWSCIVMWIILQLTTLIITRIIICAGILIC